MVERRSTFTNTRDNADHQVERLDGDGIRVGDRIFEVDVETDGSIRVSSEQGAATAWTAIGDGVRWIFVDGRVYELVEASPTDAPRRRASGLHGAPTAPMPATVRRVLVAPGAQVEAGDVLIVLEAMKMELPVRAGTPGTVKAIHCREGELVQPGVILLEIEDTPNP
jgi:biotin carboxyl carrier protein